MRLWPIVSFIVIALLLSAPVRTDATVVVERNFSEITKLSDLIFEGTVLSIEYKRVNGWIRTFVTFGDVQTLKGTVQGPYYVLQLSGGKLDGIEERIDGIPQFEVGQREILFSKDNGRSVSPIIGMWQGRFKIVSVNGRQAILDHANHPVTGLLKNDLTTTPVTPVPVGFGEYRLEVDSASFLDESEFLNLIQAELSKTAK